MKNAFYLFLIVLLNISCVSTKKTSETNSPEQVGGLVAVPGPSAVVYKTTGDFYNLVPITLNSEKTEIVSYPSPKDIYYKGELALPTKLNNGYLLDNRGINANSVFINLTYEEYSKLEKAPSIEELLEMIVEKFPFTEMYNCGLRAQYQDEINELNKLINTGKIKTQKSMLFK
ncbi:MAG: hypothetical protein ACOX4D_03885 [Bacteroidales bacterium]